MSVRTLVLMSFFAALAAGCADDRASDLASGGPSQNTLGITKDINATFFDWDTTRNPLRPGRFED